METNAYIDHLCADGERLLAVARTAPEVVVPTCPEWRVRHLVAHVGGIYVWVTRTLADKAQTRLRRNRDGEGDGEFAAIAAAYEAGLDGLLGELARTDPDARVWNWSAAEPEPARFWFRRMAQETVVHRVDAELAAGSETSIDVALAADGVDEFLGLFATYIEREPVDGLAGTIGFRAVDTGQSWGLALAPDRVERIAPDKTEATVEAPAAHLYRWILHRDGEEPLDVTVSGDQDVARRWAGVKFD